MRSTAAALRTEPPTATYAARTSICRGVPGRRASGHSAPLAQVGRLQAAAQATYHASGSSSDSGRVPKPPWGHSRCLSQKWPGCGTPLDDAVAHDDVVDDELAQLFRTGRVTLLRSLPAATPARKASKPAIRSPSGSVASWAFYLVALGDVLLVAQIAPAVLLLELLQTPGQRLGSSGAPRSPRPSVWQARRRRAARLPPPRARRPARGDGRGRPHRRGGSGTRGRSNRRYGGRLMLKSPSLVC
jgi:hypothetical protein